MLLNFFKPERKPHGYYTYRRLRAEALKYRSKREFSQKNPSAYTSAVSKKMIDIVAKDLPENTNQWSYQKVKDEALKYKTRNTFCEGSRGAYGFAHRTGIINLVCKHMDYIKWTFELCLEEAKKHNKYSDWYQAKRSGAKFAWRRGWTAEIQKIVWDR